MAVKYVIFKIKIITIIIKVSAKKKVISITTNYIDNCLLVLLRQKWVEQPEKYNISL